MVGDAGFEPTTSRPPAVRATNCANPRRYYLKISPGHVPRPRNFIFENKFSREGFLASCHRQLSPQPGALPTKLHPDILTILASYDAGRTR